MTKTTKRIPSESLAGEILLGPAELMERLAVGNWVPNVDICETAETILVRVELPGISPADIHLEIRDNVLRVHGIKREPSAVRKRISYFCLERRYGKIDRQIAIDWVIDAGRCRARLSHGILTVEIPRIKNRRGTLFEIPVVVDVE